MKEKVLLIAVLFTLLVLPQAAKAAVNEPIIEAQWVKGNLLGDQQPNLTLRMRMSGDVAPTSDTVVLAGFNLVLEMDEDYVNTETGAVDGGGSAYTNITLASPSDANVGFMSDNETPAEVISSYRLLQDVYPCATDAADRDINNAMRWDSGASLIFPISGAPAGKVWIAVTAIYQTNVDRTDVGCGANEDNFYNLVTEEASPAGLEDMAAVVDLLFILDGDALDPNDEQGLIDFFESVKVLNNPNVSKSFAFADLGIDGAPLVELDPLDPANLTFNPVLLDEFDPPTSVNLWHEYSR